MKLKPTRNRVVRKKILLRRAKIVPRVNVKPAVIPVSSDQQAEPTPNSTNARWHACAATHVGSAHVRQMPPLPCQDAAHANAGERPFLIIADGAGSALLSQHGAQTLTEGLARLFDTLADDYASALDADTAPDEARLRQLALRPVKHGLGLLRDLALRWHHPVTQFRSTLIVALGGRKRWLWLRVGDGALVIERNNALSQIGAVGKGEFANQTNFIDDTLKPEHVQYGFIDARGLTGIAAMSDGAAERLVNLGNGEVAQRIGHYFEEARQNRLRAFDLHQFFADAAVWERTTGDDRALAIAARPTA